MGKIIGIWSAYPRTGCTTLTNAIACNLLKKLTDDKKILVCCANGSKGTLLKTFGISSQEIGLEDLITYRLGGFQVDYTSVITRRGRLYLLGSNKITEHFIVNYSGTCNEVIDSLKSQYDFILVDLPNGNKNVLGNLFLEKCDSIFTIADQDIDSLTLADFPNAKADADTVLIINKYIKIYPFKSDFNKIVSYKNIYYMPYCTTLMEMRNRGKLTEYFSSQTESNKELNNIISDVFRHMISVKEDNSNLIPSSKSLLSRFKMSFQGGNQS